ncbi:tRNA-binding protein [Dyadobacter sp. OTU695]|uniref:tRNA-binding protein n=1 Tax=Dyadobacter sp. OTU695 TaxID=3043860 RepID=UPI00313BA507
MSTITWQEFEQVDLRAGTIIRVDDFPKARKPAFKLLIDLGPEIGVKPSSAQITKRYTKEQLLGRQVLCVVNFPPKQIADFRSEVLTTGFVLPDGEVILASPDFAVPNGTRLA